jgi:hypothetical protein
LETADDDRAGFAAHQRLTGSTSAAPAARDWVGDAAKGIWAA